MRNGRGREVSDGGKGRGSAITKSGRISRNESKTQKWSIWSGTGSPRGVDVRMRSRGLRTGLERECKKERTRNERENGPEERDEKKE